MSEHRSYIRHPSDIPVEFRLEGGESASTTPLANVSRGGVSFTCDRPIAAGTVISVCIEFVQPRFEARGRVAWCHEEDDGYSIGVTFLDPRDAYRARMVEQVCHIEQYKKDVREREGRTLDGRTAALEWIRKYAAKFPGGSSS
ncbi:MAG: PilZ domain-containing protein [Pseudomonadota bacterium]|nr:MAG: PilZ domain-containing protein [Pseudomonadota bacterium]